MFREGDPIFPRYRLDNYFAEGLNVVCDPDFDASPSDIPLPPEYVITTPLSLGVCCHQIMEPADSANRGHLPIPSTAPTESDPLLNSSKKTFYRPKPIWLVPFAITVALARGMTLAPRVEVYTQLSCRHINGHRPTLSSIEGSPSFAPAFVSLEVPYSLANYSSISGPSLLSRSREDDDDDPDTEDADNPLRVPLRRCLADGEVQATSARLQTLMTTVMGLLSAVTTGWWGNFSERYGRTRVLALSAFSLFLTDLIFILVSIPSSPLSTHGHRFVLLGPIIEGLIGGPGALQSVTSAYITDCTSPGSRAAVFSRFAGLTYLGITIGPSIGGWLIGHPFSGANSPTTQPGTVQKTITSTFWVSIVLLFSNFMLAAFVIPESLPQEKQRKARDEYAQLKSSFKGKPGSRDHDTNMNTLTEGNGKGVVSALRGLFGPLRILLPVDTIDTGVRRKKDWSLTILAMGLSVYYLSQGVYQLKYLYAVHTYGWGPEQLSYYISFLGGARALFLLLILPSMISVFKPPTPDKKPSRTVTAMSQGLIVERVHPSLSPIVPPSINNTMKQRKKCPMTRPQLEREICFDSKLAKVSFLVEMLSDILIAAVPAPAYTAHVANSKSYYRASEMLFAMASSLSCFGTGVSPSTQSLALCLLQVRKLDNPDTAEIEGGTGSLFGAFGILNVFGSTIIGPILFGLVYSETVAAFPKAVFALAASMLFIGFLLIMLVGNPGQTRAIVPGKIRKGKSNGRCRRYVELERGRSRVSKDLRGGAIPNYSLVP